MLIGPQRHLGGAVSGPHARPADLDATAAERDLTIVVAVTDSGPLGIPPGRRAHDVVDLFLEHLGQHPEPDAHAQRE
jgi:hypothetical protein